MGRHEEEESATLVTQEQPKSSCTTYLAEGDRLYRVQEYKKAIESYTAALERAEAEGMDKRLCYYSRALCKLYLGDSDAALEDAEEALDDDPSYSKGLWIKAEALYAMGNFEYALMFFHRGCHLRADNGEFQIGIQKSQEAIENAIGEKAKGVELSTDCDLTCFYKFDPVKKRDKKHKPGTGRIQSRGPLHSKKAEDAKKRAEEQRRAKGTKSSRKSSKRLLGQLYSDKEYLEQLFKDGVVSNDSTESGKKIRDYTNDAIKYLEKREEFWRQQDPSRTHDKTYERSSSSRRGTESSAVTKKSNPGGYVIKQIERIEKDMDKKDYKQAEKRCKETLDEALIYTDEELSNKQEFLATLYNLYGVCLFEQDKFKEAEIQFLNDWDLSENNDNQDGRSRALDSLGRVSMKLGKHEAALGYWNRKLHTMDSKDEIEAHIHDEDETLERIWLYHEIAKCHLEMKKYEEAKDFGQKALEFANESKDEAWQLNATIIIAKAEMKLEDYEAASTTFEEALELAKNQQNKEALDSIEKALRDVNQKLSQNVSQQVDEDNNYSVANQNQEQIREQRTQTPPKVEKPKEEPKAKAEEPKKVEEKKEDEVVGDGRGDGDEIPEEQELEGTEAYGEEDFEQDDETATTSRDK
ncbi:outer dynein arm-docking complex subunit 4-like isoform X2 [Symsagittifera roscoffensis]